MKEEHALHKHFRIKNTAIRKMENIKLLDNDWMNSPFSKHSYEHNFHSYTCTDKKVCNTFT
jgi:hypothetical protein